MRENGVATTPIEELPFDAWTETHWQLADVRDRLAVLSWQYVCAHRDPKTPAPPAPDPVPRPGAPKRKGVSAWFDAFATS